MKRVILIILLTLGFIPFVQKGKIVVLTNSASAQNYGSENNYENDYGIDYPEDCLNCRIEENNFNDFKETLEGLGLTFSTSDFTLTNGVEGEMTEIYNANGDTVGAFFKPDEDADADGGLPSLDADIYYSMMGGKPGGDDETGGSGGDPGGDPPSGPNPNDPGDDYSDLFDNYMGGSEIPYTPPPPKFTHLDWSTLSSDIVARRVTPSLVNQSSTGLCGMACIARVFIDKHPAAYSDMLFKLYQNGEATYGPTNFHITAKSILSSNSLFDVDPASSSYPSGMSQADFLFLSSLKNTQNNFFTYNPTNWYNQFSGISLPSGMASMMTDFLGLQYVINSTALVDNSYTYEDLQVQATGVAGGRTSFLFIDDQMINGPSGSGSSPYADHWVQFLGNLSVNTTTQMMSFKIFTWGGEQTVTVSFAAFHHYYYGSVSGY
jgi:hypothetical protein